MGMDWWTGDPFFSPHAAGRNDHIQTTQTSDSTLEQQNHELHSRITALEEALRGHQAAIHGTPIDQLARQHAPHVLRWSTAERVIDANGRVAAEPTMRGSGSPTISASLST
jgi:hypothetical protein